MRNFDHYSHSTRSSRSYLRHRLVWIHAGKQSIQSWPRALRIHQLYPSTALSLTEFVISIAFICIIPIAKIYSYIYPCISRMSPMIVRFGLIIKYLIVYARITTIIRPHPPRQRLQIIRRATSIDTQHAHPQLKIKYAQASHT